VSATINNPVPITGAVTPDDLEEWYRTSCAGVVRGKACSHRPSRACRRCLRAYCGHHAYGGDCPRCRRKTEAYDA
jgi:hypothetical protein